MAGVVVVFDFDRTLIDGDSDRWVVTQMGLTPLFNQFLSALPWNSLMNRMMKELHARGKTAEDIADCLSRTPLHPRIAAAIKWASALGCDRCRCDLRIVSDANQFFIESILEHHGLSGCFSQLHTNPSYVDHDGMIRILPYHALSSPPHGCSLCPANLCKGMVIEQIRASNLQNENWRFIYLGDGKGDYCPSLRFGEDDYIMPRKNYPLWDCIRSNPTLVKAGVYEWTDGEELEKILVQLVNTISSDRKILSL